VGSGVRIAQQKKEQRHQWQTRGKQVLNLRLEWGDGDAHHMREMFSNFGVRLFHYAKNRHDQGGHMSTVTAVVLSMLLLTMTGCVASSPPPAVKQETGKKASPVKPAKHDEGRSMNEESQEAVR
jgi:hypothetical protein